MFWTKKKDVDLMRMTAQRDHWQIRYEKLETTRAVCCLDNETRAHKAEASLVGVIEVLRAHADRACKCTLCVTVCGAMERAEAERKAMN